MGVMCMSAWRGRPPNESSCGRSLPYRARNCPHDFLNPNRQIPKVRNSSGIAERFSGCFRLGSYGVASRLGIRPQEGIKRRVGVKDVAGVSGLGNFGDDRVWSGYSNY